MVGSKVEFFSDWSGMATELKVSEHAICQVVILRCIGLPLQLLFKELQVSASLLQLVRAHGLSLLHVAREVSGGVTLCTVGDSCNKFRCFVALQASRFAVWIVRFSGRRDSIVRMGMCIAAKEKSQAWRAHRKPLGSALGHDGRKCIAPTRRS